MSDPSDASRSTASIHTTERTSTGRIRKTDHDPTHGTKPDGRHNSHIAKAPIPHSQENHISWVIPFEARSQI